MVLGLSQLWMDDLRFYVLMKSISVISRRWATDNESPFMIEKISTSGEA